MPIVILTLELSKPQSNLTQPICPEICCLWPMPVAGCKDNPALFLILGHFMLWLFCGASKTDLQVKVGHFSPAGTLDDLNEGEQKLVGASLNLRTSSSSSPHRNGSASMLRKKTSVVGCRRRRRRCRCRRRRCNASNCRHWEKNSQPRPNIRWMLFCQVMLLWCDSRCCCWYCCWLCSCCYCYICWCY